MPIDIVKGLAVLGIDTKEESASMIAYWDKNLICRYANHAYLDWFGLAPEQMINKIYIHELLGPSLYEQNLPYIKGVLKGNVQVFHRDIISVKNQKRSSIATYVPDLKGVDVIGFYSHVEDVTPKKSDALFRLQSEKYTEGKAFLNHADQQLLDIEQELQNSILGEFPGIEYLAKHYFISQSKLKTDFKAKFNKSIFAYYRHLQMDFAHKFITEKNCSKKQVAALLNFANPSNFSNCYKKYLKEKHTQDLIDNLTRTNDDRFKIFVTQSPFAIAMFDKQLVFQAASQRFIDDYHLHHQPLTGTHLSAIFPNNDQKWTKIYKGALKGEIYHGEDAFIERENKSPLWIRYDVRPWYDSHHQIGGIFIYTEDITSVKLKEEENRKILEILNKASELVRIGAWKRNFKNDTVIWNQVMREILEVPEDYVVSPEFNFQFNTKGKSRNLMEQVITDAIENGRSFDVIAEIITAKKSIKKVRVVGYAEFRNGKCERLFGIFQELTGNHAVKLKRTKTRHFNY
jgi:PAS domain S-box-containing protein